MQTQSIISFIAKSFLISVFAGCLFRCTGICESLGLYSSFMHFSLLKGTSQNYVDRKYGIIISLNPQIYEIFTDCFSGFCKLASWLPLARPVTNDQKRVTARRQVFCLKLKMPCSASGTKFLDLNYNVYFGGHTKERSARSGITAFVGSLRQPRRIWWSKRVREDNIKKRNRAWGCGPDSCGSRWSAMLGYCEHSNENSDIMDGEDFLD